MQHGMCSGLMKQFMTTAEFVANEMMPMMKQVIKKRKSKIIRDMLEQILEQAREMKKEAENVRDRYCKLTGKLQQNIADVNTRNATVMQQTERLAIEREKAESLKQQSEEEQKEMEEERRRTLNAIQKMKEQRDELFAGAIPSDVDDKTWNDLMNMSVPTMVSKLDGISAGIQAIKMPLTLIRQGMRTYAAIKGGQQAQEAIDKEDEKQNKLREEIRKRKETTQERLAQIKRTDLRIATLGDISGLLEALKQLSKVDELFAEIILFWDNMLVFLKSLHDKTGAGKSFLTALKTKKYAKMFEETISRAEAEWRKFGAICRAYAMQTDQDTRMVYRFLSTPVDLMDVTERQSRIRQLTYDIEQNMLQLEF
ncbi:uncharacterized protein LOC132715723 [Ruditapes philippinarum]|uniref:uncharacterized protein LOC132715723 n=1 Tax=Ruditapes philippinarum TaxID=129788 RepID=UPI00295B51FF|nr:uncharacterized protein LOC132715723 [Ruditapes philippinarum]